MGIIISRRHHRENITSIEMPSRFDSRLTGAKILSTSNATIWKFIKDVHKSLFSRKFSYLPSMVFAVVLFVGGFFVSLFKCASLMKEVDWTHVALTMQVIGGIIILYYLVLRLAKYYAEWKLSREEGEKEAHLLLEEEDEGMKHLLEKKEAEENLSLLKESEQWLHTRRREVLTMKLIEDRGDIQQSAKSVQYDDDIITDCHLTPHRGEFKEKAKLSMLEDSGSGKRLFPPSEDAAANKFGVRAPQLRVDPEEFLQIFRDCALAGDLDVCSPPNVTISPDLNL